MRVLFISPAVIDARRQVADMDQDVAVASRSLLAGVVAAHPALWSFSLTVWHSRMAAVGLG